MTTLFVFIPARDEEDVTVFPTDASYSGILRGGETATVSVDDNDLSDGSTTPSTWTTAGSFDRELSYTTRWTTEDASIDVNNDGSADASISGELQPGVTATRSVNDGLLRDGSNTFVFGASQSEFDWSLDYTAVTAAKNPGVDVTGDGTDDATYRWHATEASKTYELWSETFGLLRDDATADGPVELSGDDTAETLRIQLASDSTESGTGGGGGGYSGAGVTAPIATSSGLLESVPVVIGAAVLVVGVVALVLRRFLSDQLLVLGGTAAAGIVALVLVGESYRPGIVLGSVGRGLGRMVPVASLVAIGLGSWWFYRRYIRGQTTIIQLPNGKRLR